MSDAPSYIEIIDEDEVFEWSPLNPETRKPYDSVFMLRRMSAKERLEIQDKYTSLVKGKRGQRIEQVDSENFGRECLDKVIVDWKHFYYWKRNEAGEMERHELPCTPETKVKLPETIKADIVTMCIGGDMSETDIKEMLVPFAPTTTTSRSAVTPMRAASSSRKAPVKTSG